MLTLVQSIIAQVFISFFQATLEGWFEAMADAHDARGVDLQPGYRRSYLAQMFFVIFILLGSFFILNLFIGVIIDNFNRLKQQYEDGEGIFLTADQRNWINTLKVASLKKPCRITKRPNVSYSLYAVMRLVFFLFVSSLHIKMAELLNISYSLCNVSYSLCWVPPTQIIHGVWSFSQDRYIRLTWYFIIHLFIGNLKMIIGANIRFQNGAKSFIPNT